MGLYFSNTVNGSRQTLHQHMTSVLSSSIMSADCVSCKDHVTMMNEWHNQIKVYTSGRSYGGRTELHVQLLAQQWLLLLIALVTYTMTTWTHFASQSSYKEISFVNTSLWASFINHCIHIVQFVFVTQLQSQFVLYLKMKARLICNSGDHVGSDVRCATGSTCETNKTQTSSESHNTNVFMSIVKKACSYMTANVNSLHLTGGQRSYSAAHCWRYHSYNLACGAKSAEWDLQHLFEDKKSS